jgi:hypothetical protein
MRIVLSPGELRTSIPATPFASTGRSLSPIVRITPGSEMISIGVRYVTTISPGAGVVSSVGGRGSVVVVVDVDVVVTVGGGSVVTGG